MAANSVGPPAPLPAMLDSFWICRISILRDGSSSAGAPQAQSLFLDMHTCEVGRWHWMGFHGAVFLFWMLPTQLSTRREKQCTGS
jgi:hypothetical protein